MRILLTAINAKYIHSNLAVYSLKASAGNYEPQIAIAEYTINHQADDIFAGIYRQKPDILLFSCYIWNRREVLEAADSIRKVLPETVIWAGGPEVSYDAEAFLRENPQFDGVMIGEGEQTFCRLLEYYIDGIGTLEELPGIAWTAGAERTDKLSVGRTENGNRKDDRKENDRREISVSETDAPFCQSLDSLPFVYQDLEQFENRIIYYESSRGCPFSCSYCLSSIDKRVRYRSVELVEQELLYFLEKRVKQVKFVDRTFNCSHERTLRLWRFIREHDNGVTNFHFEISADLLNEEELEVLSGMRPGLVQLEIGVQTVNPEALRAIHRTARFEQIAEHVNRVFAGHNVHQHLDLIAGLPYEDFESFRDSFDAVYRLYGQELQLGFLKVLKGSEMYRKAEKYGIVYRSTPPYEVLETKWITCDELLRLKEVEEMLEVYYNSQQFRTTIRAAETLFERPIELYEALADYYKEKKLAGKSYSRMQRLEILRDFLRCRAKKQFEGLAEQTAEALAEQTAEAECLTQFDRQLLLDLYLRENAKSRPCWAPDPAEWKERAVRFYQQEAQTHQYLPGMAEMNWKQLMRMTHLEPYKGGNLSEMKKQNYGIHADVPVQRSNEEQTEYLLFDYSRRDPLTGDAMVQTVVLF